MKRTALLLTALLVMAGPVLAERTVEETRPLAPDGRVEISNVSGSVKVVGWSGEGVEISARLDDGVKELEISSSGSRLSIDVELESRKGYSSNAYLVVKMPTTADLEVETVSATISVDGVGGEVELESVSGKIEVSGEPESLDAASVSGNVVATSTGPRAELETVSGEIIVRSAAGRLEANVVSGDISIDGGVLDSFTGESVSGSIVCAARPADGGRFDLETMSGSIELVVPSDISAEFDIETYSGSISNQIGPEPRRTGDYGPGKQLRFTNGSGGAKISVESFSGSVKLRTN